MTLDLLGRLIRATPDFRGKWRLRDRWWANRRAGDVRFAQLPAGPRVRCDIGIPYEAVVWLGELEKGDLDRLTQLLSPGEVFVDCGANMGIWSLTAAQRVGRSGQVFAFEPHPVTFEKLAANIRLNGCEDRITARQLALSEAPGTANFACQTDKHEMSGLSDAAGPNVTQVRLSTLDAELAGRAVAGIKIDVEGHELGVLRGAAGVLARCRPWVCVEFNTWLTGPIPLAEWPVHRFLAERDFSPALFPADAPAGELPPSWTTKGYVNLLYRPRG